MSSNGSSSSASSDDLFEALSDAFGTPEGVAMITQAATSILVAVLARRAVRKTLVEVAGLEPKQAKRVLNAFTSAAYLGTVSAMTAKRMVQQGEKISADYNASQKSKPGSSAPETPKASTHVTDI